MMNKKVVQLKLVILLYFQYLRPMKKMVLFNFLPFKLLQYAYDQS